MNVNYPSGGIASLLSSQGRNGDSMLIHMAPEEVQGLQSLAMAAGGSLSINPETGLYEASFLKKLLPTLLGIGLSFIPGVGPLAAAGLVGAGETIRTGDLGKGLMAGLGAYGGAGLAGGLAGAGTLAKAGVDKVALQQTLGGEAAKSTLQSAAQQAAQQGVKTYGSNILGGVKALGDAGIGAAAKGLGSTLGTTGVAGLGMGVANAMTPEYKPPKGSDEENLYYISQGYDPEKGFLGGEYVKKYPGLPGYAEGGDVASQPQQDLKSYYQSLLAAPQQAPQQNAALQQYMTDLNKFVATSGPTAPKTSPTYVAPPPPPKEEPKKDEPKKDEPKKDDRKPGWDQDIDWDMLSQFNINREDVENALRNYNAGNMGMGQTQNQNINTTRTGGVANPFVEGYTPDFNNLDYTQLPGYGGNAGMNSNMDRGADRGLNTGMNIGMDGGIPQDSFDMSQIPGYGNNTGMNQGMSIGQDSFDISQVPGYGNNALDMFRGIQNNPDMPTGNLTDINQFADPVYNNSNIPTGNLTDINQFADPMYDNPYLSMTGGMGVGGDMSRPRMEDYGMQNYMDNFGEFNNMYSGGGSLGGYSDGGRMLRGPGDGMSDNIPAEIRGRKGRQPARLADGEFVVPADVVSHLGNGSSEAGSRKLYKMMDNIRRARTGRTKQAPAVKADKYLPRK